MILQYLHVNYIFFIQNKVYIDMDNNFLKYLSTMPVLGALWLTFTAGFIIEINRFFPDILFFSF